jgi:hypothetical protein
MGNSHKSKDEAHKFQEILPYRRSLITDFDQNSKEASVRYLKTKVKPNYI